MVSNCFGEQNWNLQVNSDRWRGNLLGIWASVTNATDWVAHQQQTFISHGFRSWETLDQGTGRVGVW